VSSSVSHICFDFRDPVNCWKDLVRHHAIDNAYALYTGLPTSLEHDCLRKEGNFFFFIPLTQQTAVTRTFGNSSRRSTMPPAASRALRSRRVRRVHRIDESRVFSASGPANIASLCPRFSRMLPAPHLQPQSENMLCPAYAPCDLTATYSLLYLCMYRIEG